MRRHTAHQLEQSGNKVPLHEKTKEDVLRLSSQLSAVHFVPRSQSQLKQSAMSVRDLNASRTNAQTSMRVVLLSSSAGGDGERAHNL